ncbi:hypothetical protein CAMRE0001_0450 [Campylobacter rectus RM3267]|uniref:Uncharacterized protein n=1 Tax=Campylobacter rectus RM3267 TaxID=553218 RepID=B9D3N1_CAMRE|nr:hypothetical protein CAMRE0001_0450 [Campylobacter rectus RM3267]
MRLALLYFNIFYVGLQNIPSADVAFSVRTPYAIFQNNHRRSIGEPSGLTLSALS